MVQLQLVALQVPPTATLQPTGAAADAASPVSDVSNRGAVSVSPSDDGSEALAYAPPGHHRKNSCELQDDDWEADWEVWAAGESAGDSASTHTGGSPQQQQQNKRSKQLQKASGQLLELPDLQLSTAAAAAGAVRGTTSSGGAAAAADVRALLPPGGNSSSSSFAAPEQQQQQQHAADLKRRRQQQPPEVAGQSQNYQAMLQAESKQLPLAPLLLICTLFIAVLLTSLFSKLAGCGTVGFWLMQAAVAPALAVIFWAGRRRVLRNVAVKRAAQYDFHGDIRWTRKNSVLFPAICSLSGVIAGLFGLVS
jgi:hypothetical protein